MLAQIAPYRESSDVTRNPVPFTARDRRALTLRLIRSSDAPRLEQLFSQLSPESRWRRFHAPAENIAAERITAQAALMADVDNRTHEGAVVVVAKEGVEEQIVGVVRLARPSGFPMAEEAEAAIVVLDAYQGQGVGSELLRQMIHLARHMHIKRIVAVFQADNAEAIRLFRKLGLPSKLLTSHGISEMFMEMPATGYETHSCNQENIRW
ncbi:MAG: GNAT family N-acetyltransferase [Caldilinea sp.]